MYSKNILVRFQELYPREYEAFSGADSEAEIMILQERFLRERKQKLMSCLTENRLSADRKNDINILQDANETVAVILHEELYNQLINAKGSEIEKLLVEMFDGVERLKDMGSQDAESMAYAMSNAGLAALGIAMCTQLIADIMVGMNLNAAMVAALASVSLGTVGIVIDIIVLAIIPIFYFMSKPAACIFAVINDLDVDLEINEEAVIHGKLNVKTKIIPAAAASKSILRSAGIWSTQKTDAALIGTQYGVNFVQKKGKFSGTEPDDTVFSVGVECPLASGLNSCAVGFDKSAENIGKEANAKQKQEVAEENKNYKIEMRCHNAHGSIAYYICRISRK